MKTPILLVRVTAAALGLQLLLGGLLTFGYISKDAHIAFGAILFILAIATMGVWFTVKPAVRQMRILTAVIVLLIVLQAGLGFAYLGNGNLAFALIHYLTALVIFGVTMAASFMAMRWDRMPAMEKPAAPAPS